MNKFRINKGDEFLSKHDLKLRGKPVFSKGKIYTSEMDGYVSSGIGDLSLDSLYDIGVLDRKYTALDSLIPLKDPKMIIGKRINGFWFVSRMHKGVEYTPDMNKFVDVAGVVASYNRGNDTYTIHFPMDDVYHEYPCELISRNDVLKPEIDYSKLAKKVVGEIIEILKQ